MQTTPSLNKLNRSTWTDIRPALKLPPEAEALVATCMTLPEALARLEANNFLFEAAKLVAYALPPREAVWWVCMCADHTAPADLPAPNRKARESAERWVRQPSDAHRAMCKATADAAEAPSPESWAALAVSFCGPPAAQGQAALPPNLILAGRVLAGAVVLAAVRDQPSRQWARAKLFLQSGKEVASGGLGRLPPEQP